MYMNKQDKQEADTESESLADLPVTDEQANQTKAGASTAVFNNFRVQYVFADFEDAAR
jgi:hypothetical protein